MSEPRNVWEWLATLQDTAVLSVDSIFERWLEEVTEGESLRRRHLAYPIEVYRKHFRLELDRRVRGGINPAGKPEDQTWLFFDTGGFPYRVIVRQGSAIVGVEGWSKHIEAHRQGHEEAKRLTLRALGGPDRG